MLYVGGGVIKAEAPPSCCELAELTGIPVVTTLMARGAFPDSHRQHLGCRACTAPSPRWRRMQKADLLIALGARFDDRVTGQLTTLRARREDHPRRHRPGRDRQEPPRRRADRRRRTRGHHRADRGGRAPSRPRDTAPTSPRGGRSSTTCARDLPARLRLAADGSLSPQYVIERLGEIAGPDAIYAAGVGQHQMWAAQFIRYEKPRTWLNSGGLGTMGYAVPAAMGAKIGRPDTDGVGIDGDGCFQMTNQELATCAIEGIPIKVAVINNGNLGMVRQWQTLFYERALLAAPTSARTSTASRTS